MSKSSPSVRTKRFEVDKNDYHGLIKAHLFVDFIDLKSDKKID